MAIHQVIAPGGAQFFVSAPDNASEQAVIARADASHGQVPSDRQLSPFDVMAGQEGGWHVQRVQDLARTGVGWVVNRTS